MKKTAKQKGIVEFRLEGLAKERGLSVKAFLQQRYETDGSMRRLAEEMWCSAYPLYMAMRRRGIKCVGRTKHGQKAGTGKVQRRVADYGGASWLRERIQQGWRQADIARFLQCTTGSMYGLLNHFGVNYARVKNTAEDNGRHAVKKRNGKAKKWQAPCKVLTGDELPSKEYYLQQIERARQNEHGWFYLEGQG